MDMLIGVYWLVTDFSMSEFLKKTLMFGSERSLKKSEMQSFALSTSKPVGIVPISGDSTQTSYADSFCTLDDYVHEEMNQPDRTSNPEPYSKGSKNIHNTELIFDDDEESYIDRNTSFIQASMFD